jgi:Fur family ferric uptake transcriptional regulator
MITAELAAKLQASHTMLRRKLPRLLKTHGYSLTTKRQLIFSALVQAPLTTQEIFVKLKNQSKSIDLASIYRNLQIFEELGLVQAVQLTKGKKHYELISAHHHHHVVCQSCGFIKNITLPSETALLQVATEKTDFQITGHTLEFFGLCAQCQ